MPRSKKIALIFHLQYFLINPLVFLETNITKDNKDYLIAPGFYANKHLVQAKPLIFHTMKMISLF